MNISSVVISTQPNKMDKLIDEIRNCDACEYQIHDDKGRIVVTIEAENVNAEVAALKRLQQMPNVIDAVMSFSYSEDELNQNKEKLELTNNIPDWLNNPNAELKDIKYNGDLKGRF